MTRKLIIAPHVDDEVLGCGGIIDSDTLVLHCGLAEMQNHGNDIVSKTDRLKEFEDIKKSTGCKSILLENTVNRYTAKDIISDIEKSINDFMPDIAFIPTPSYNQDHQEVYKASIVALRPHDLNYFVPKVVMYEQPQDLWSGKEEQFNPNFFVKIDIEKKINLYSLLKSQVREHRGIRIIKNLASLRGSQSNCDYAESFKILRWVSSDKIYKEY
tara:strand:+ start:32291 stop:32932 length:642 start_codon:yes stop_codon:yes gene_type:complete